MYSSPVYLADQKSQILLVDTSLNNNVRWSPVYSKRLTINKGVDNLLQFQFLNQEQKPVDISLFSFTFNLISQDGLSLLYSSPLEKVNARLGTTQLIIPAAQSINFDSQPASWSIVRSSLGTVSSITVTDPGRGYVTAPTVTIGGVGTGARANAVISGGIDQFVILDAGSGYVSTPTVTITGGGGSNARAQAQLTFGVGSIEIIDAGFGYIANATANITASPTGDNAAAQVFIDSGYVVGIEVTNPGSGYVTPPTVRIESSDTISNVAQAQAYLSGRVAGITLLSPGTGYIGDPVITIEGPADTVAEATANITNRVSSIRVTNSGSGYFVVPLVTLTGGLSPSANANVDGATAVASIRGDDYMLPAYVDDAASARGAADIVDSALPQFQSSYTLTLPVLSQLMWANTGSYNMADPGNGSPYQDITQTSVITSTGSPLLTFAVSMANYSGQIQPQGSADPDNDLLWYNINDAYTFSRVSGIYSFNVQGFHPYIRLQVSVAGSANVANINQYITDIRYR